MSDALETFLFLPREYPALAAEQVRGARLFANRRDLVASIDLPPDSVDWGGWRVAGGFLGVLDQAASTTAVYRISISSRYASMAGLLWHANR